ncbi:aldo/keto reductase [Sciscionella marina]|uniref:aldo/keto reductase n=1 Tax=Sciscionella marina TaxID=508770 RepID=UPI000476235D|nr:aldo/keto reductase [Sciscionella marina]
MRQRRLGTSGLVVSTVGLGCDNLGRPGTGTSSEEGATAVVRAAVESGITYFDVADVYGSPRGRAEELLGNAVGPVRDSVLLGTKFGMAGRGDFGAHGSRRYIRLAVEGSLRRLGTDWIDLYQLHRPDPSTPLAETMGALDDLVRAGKIRYFGIGNFAGWQLADAVWTAARAHGVTPVTAVNHYSLLDRSAERELLPAARRFDLGLLPYFPLANGLLTGKYAEGVTPRPGWRLAGRPDLLANAPWRRIEALREFAAIRGLDLTTVAIGWLAAQRPVGSVIAGATTVDQVWRNTAAADWVPTPEDCAAIDAICQPGV